MIILLKLLLAHMVGDFFLQPKHWVEEKELKKVRSSRFYFHILIHGVLVGVVMWDISFLPWAIAVMVIHGLIDILKIYIQRDSTRRIWFFADQMLHVFSLFAIYLLYTESTFSLDIFDENFTPLITSVVFLSFPSAYLIKAIVAKWSSQTGDSNLESLEDAGKYIGILERLFVFAFVITNNWEAIGFLLAAKSVFRFGDLKESKDRKLTEYILIGTLVSFGIAIITGLIYMQ